MVFATGSDEQKHGCACGPGVHVVGEQRTSFGRERGCTVPLSVACFCRRGVLLWALAVTAAEAGWDGWMRRGTFLSRDCRPTSVSQIDGWSRRQAILLKKKTSGRNGE